MPRKVCSGTHDADLKHKMTRDNISKKNIGCTQYDKIRICGFTATWREGERRRSEI